MPLARRAAARPVRRHRPRSQEAIARSPRPGSGTAQRVDGLDGVAFEPGEYYLTLATLDRRGATGVARPSDYTGQQIYYRSIQERETDLLTMLRLPVALGHRLVLVLAARSARSTRVVRRLWPRRLPPLATSTTGWSGSTAASGSPTGSTGGPGVRGASG